MLDGFLVLDLKFIRLKDPLRRGLTIVGLRYVSLVSW